MKIKMLIVVNMSVQITRQTQIRPVNIEAPEHQVLISEDYILILIHVVVRDIIRLSAKRLVQSMKYIRTLLYRHPANPSNHTISRTQIFQFACAYNRNRSLQFVADFQNHPLMFYR